MHDVGQLPRQVPVVGFHLVVVLLLILFDQALVDTQRLTAGVYKLPARDTHERIRSAPK